MGFGQGLSGLDAASQNLDIIGNNIANAGTVGFKASTANFADIYASSKVGLGVTVAAVDQRFTVGDITSTGGQYDIAIDGQNGFFRMVDGSGQVSYTRDGEFGVDKNNFIVNAQGNFLTGFSGTTIGTAPVPLSLPQADIPPEATSTSGFVANLDANAAPIDSTTTPFDPTNNATYTNSQSMTVYDSLGNSHQLTQYFVKQPADTTTGNSVYQVYYTLDGSAMAPTTASAATPPVYGGAATLEFNAAGALASVAATTTPASTGNAVNLSFATPGGTSSPAAALTISMDYTGTTQFGNDFSANFTPNGQSAGQFTDISIANDGSVVANYSNGASQTVGTIALANFNNVQGLQPISGNAWLETSASGQAVLGQPGTNGLATLTGQSLEASNVDLSTELVNMIVAQRTYQANTQTIKTQDQVLQSLLSIE
jgi:flagellar hook protein FlgE